MMAEIATSVSTCSRKLRPASVPSEMTMISADRMKSVRIAPRTLSFSNATMSTLPSWIAATRSAWRWSSSPLCRNLCASFSTPSKQRNAPPSIISGVTSGTL